MHYPKIKLKLAGEIVLISKPNQLERKKTLNGQ